MHFLLSIALVLQIISAVVVIVLVLMQHGKGADLGAAFGAGASGSLFCATGLCFRGHRQRQLPLAFNGHRRYGLLLLDDRSDPRVRRFQQALRTARRRRSFDH